MSIIDHKINRVGILYGDNLRITPTKLISQQGKQASSFLTLMLNGRALKEKKLTQDEENCS